MTYPNAFISVQSGQTNNRLKIYKDNKIFLDGGSEFQIEFENYTNKVWLAKILINNNFISNSGLILKPGQHIYLDRYLDASKKFKFDTYFVDDNQQTKEAIKNNGMIEVLFYEEFIPIPITCWNWPTNQHVEQWVSTPQYYTTTNISAGSQNTMQFCTTTGVDNSTKNLKSISLKKETGRIEEGSHSNQTFQYEDKSFNSLWSKQVKYQLLPILENKENVRQYCTACGYRLRDDKWLFCPKCGNKQ